MNPDDDRPKFNHGDKVQQLPLRDFIRDHCLTPHQGLIVEDLDLIIRRYTIEDEFGRFRLIEHKQSTQKLYSNLKGGQVMTFGLVDAMLRIADPDLVRYEGLFILTTPTEDIEHTDTFYVNGHALTRDRFIDWCNFGQTKVAPRRPGPKFARYIAAALDEFGCQINDDDDDGLEP